ncbi:polysaccharide biosynthesis C-terminal domain-containing protein [Aerococcaceae bacterium INB8]|uniref:Polysaccharide biosynthesis C-terminal domain-containing protein n=1 Tax=Ruoffia halotolerans TaxID=2748684 RepID=A0A839A798_9LACT|nr:polysaccharide biosynthesis C-terminal domain-containing protein [Ruoffia halotolerans]MBA5730176.1 polysaccharide biosynthesis C-terminal domain-containing protein [Ruoffia halotolerans]
MNQVQKLKLNTIISLVSKIVIMLSGIILPRLILVNFGSEVNGLVNSVTQFLAVITFLDLGVGSVVQSALYKPLVENDSVQISGILKSARNYFQKIGIILIVYVFILILTYPLIVENNILGYVSTTYLIISISISTFAQYYFGIVNELLLNSDQKGYVQLLAETIVVILNLVLSVIFINLGFSIVTVKFVSSLVILIRPIYLTFYVNKNYQINYEITLDDDPLPQKWNGMGQHIAYSIQNSTDIIVLTIFSTLDSVSIYSVYKMIINAIGLIINSFTMGLQSFFGNLLASDNLKKLNSYFSTIEWGLHNLIVFLYAMSAVLIIPFIQIYTQGVNDADYVVPSFALILVVSKGIFSLRIPYQSIVFSAGYFKQTQASSYIEAILNLSLSLLFVSRLGLVGVAIGSLIAMSYRLLYLIFFLQKNIIFRSIKKFIKLLIMDIVAFLLIFITGNLLKNYFSIESYIHWCIFAIAVSMLSFSIIIFLNLCFYRNRVFELIRKNIRWGQN